MPKIKLKPSELNEADLLTLEEVYTKLGAGYSPRTLRRKIASGEYKQGVHYFRTGGNSGIIKVYLPAIKQWLIDVNT